MTTTLPAGGTAAPELLAYATCPLCRTTAATATTGADWLCGRCGQRWTSTRLASVTAYAAWVAEQQLIPAR